MPKKIHYVGGLPVEGPALNQKTAHAHDELTKLVLAEYQRSGTVCSFKVCEAVAAYETYVRHQSTEAGK